jgi:hypothetical protein
MEKNSQESISKVLNTLFEQHSSNHEEILKIKQKDIYITELKSIIDEICYCLLFNLNIAAITATNHLLESLLKRAIVYKETGNTPLKSLDEIENKYKPVIDDIMKLPLVKTIELSHKKGLINDSQKKELSQYRNALRNGFSHAEPQKIFGNKTTPIAMGSFIDPNHKTEIKELPTKYLLLIHGVALDQLARARALPYFKYVHDVMLGIEKKLTSKG